MIDEVIGYSNFFIYFWCFCYYSVFIIFYKLGCFKIFDKPRQIDKFTKAFYEFFTVVIEICFFFLRVQQ